MQESLWMQLVTYFHSEKWNVSLIKILRIVPSLAVLLLLIPLMGTGIKPALIALILLGIPPILMNTISGLNHIPVEQEISMLSSERLK
ncbi:ABC transporter permease subunit [Paenibacillus sp. UASWS1643]|uniref:ABC transporter permease subunit n=1 Tax=Paenibacillus sp. UASWS1643 TaxID=2580422 RepID=UPI001CC284E4|nr:ABC transporter permease subunit [Paenibacillus sp. UASWS1643]